MARWQGLRRALETPLDTPGTALIVTAHPDDETLFFLPTLQGLHAQGAQVALLCLSTGTCASRTQVF